MTLYRANTPVLHFDDTNGKPLVGGKLYVYEAGTDTPSTTYRDKDGTDVNENPVSLDERGECVVFIDGSKEYKFVLEDGYGTVVWEEDNVTSGGQGGSGGGVNPNDIKPLVLKQFGKTLGNYNPLLGNTIEIGNSAVQIDVSTSRIYSVIQSILADERTPVLVKTVHRDYGTEEFLYYPTARTGASSDYYFIGYNGGLLEFAKVKDNDSVSYETYEGGEGRIVYIGYGDADIYTKVSDAFAAGLVPVVKADTTIWTNYYWPLNLSAYVAPVPGEEDGRNGYYFVGKAEIKDSEGNPLAALEMIQVKPDSSVSTSYIPERQTPREEYSDLYGIGLKTNSFGQVTEITDGTQQSAIIDTGIGYTSHVLTAEEIAQGYYDIHIGLPSLVVRGKNIVPDSLLITSCEVLACIRLAFHDDYMEYSVNKLEVLIDSIEPNNGYDLDYVCRVDDFAKDEFGRLIPNDLISGYINYYRYNFLRTPFRRVANQYIRGFIVRNYINSNYNREMPIEPGMAWPGPHVDITVSAKAASMLSIIANRTTVANPNTLRFKFSDQSYSPVDAGVGLSGIWTKRQEFYSENIWDWTYNNSSWTSKFADAWTEEDMDMEFVELIAAGDTSAITSVRQLFSGCSALKSAIAFDTSNVTNFTEMFAGCTELEAVPYFKTDSATYVNSMFDGCTNVKSGALSLYTRMSGQATPPDYHGGAFVDCGKDTTEGYAELLQIPASWGGLAP